MSVSNEADDNFVIHSSIAPENNIQYTRVKLDILNKRRFWAGLAIQPLTNNGARKSVTAPFAKPLNIKEVA